VYAGLTELRRATKWAELSAEQRRAYSYMMYAPPSSEELPRLRPVVRMVDGWVAVAKDEAPGGVSGQVDTASLAAAPAPKPDSAYPPLARTPPVKRAPPPLPRNTAKLPAIKVAEQSSERPGTKETADGWSTDLHGAS